MKRIALILAFCVSLGNPVFAQGGMGPGPGTVHSTGGAAFSGVGDAFPSAAFWAGLEAYTAAVAATGTQRSIKLLRASDNVECDILIATTGFLGLTTSTCNSSTQGGITPIAFAGTDATGNATSAGTAVAMTGLSSAAHVGDTITGTGYVGSYCVSVGALVAGAQTCTTNTSQTIGVSAPITLTVALYGTVFYDQSGNGNNCAPNTTPQRPLFIASGGTSATRPWLALQAGQSFDCSITGPSQPFTIAAVSIRAGAFTTQQTIASEPAPNFTQFSYGTSASTVFAYAGTSTSNITASDSAWHGLQAIYNGSSSIVNVDGSATSSLNTGTNALSGLLGIGSVFGTTTGAMTGGITQLGVWPSGANGTQQTNVNAAMHTNGGF